MKNSIIIKCMLLLFPSIILNAAASDYPQWWYDLGIIDTDADAGNWALVNQGQMKNMAQRAQVYMAYKLGLDIDEWDTQWEQIYSNAGYTAPSFENTGNNYVLINQGQAKNIVWGFYEMLYEEGYTISEVESMLADHTTSGSWSYEYPWDSTADTSHYSPLLIGQLKFMFCFDLGDVDGEIDIDGDGIDDLTELDSTATLNALGNPNDEDYDLYPSFVEGLMGTKHNSYTTGEATTTDYDAISGPLIVTCAGSLFQVAQSDMTLSVISL